MAASDFIPAVQRGRRPRGDNVSGARVRALREARRIAQADLAGAIGMSPTLLSRIETGGRNGNTWRLQLARRLTVHPDVLTGQLPVLAILREARGLDPADFAATVGITPEHLHRLETGAELPDQPLLIRLANRLAVDPAAIAPNAPEALTAGTG